MSNYNRLINQTVSCIVFLSIIDPPKKYMECRSTSLTVYSRELKRITVKNSLRQKKWRSWL